jgi:tetratricopeptide (TPR) repeat protein
VFGLGAILCEVLTGKPPYADLSSVAVLRAAVRGDLDGARARLAASGADAELVELAGRCLAAEPADRPRDAGAVAAAVAEYQAAVEARLRAAVVERAEAQARAAGERKRRRLAVLLAAAVVTAVLIAAGGGLAVQAERAARAAEAGQRAAEAEAALAEAERARERGRWADARAALERARGRLGDGGPEPLRRRLGQAAADLEMVATIDGIRLRQAALRTGEGLFDVAGSDPEYAAAFRGYGIDVDALDPEAAAAAVRASAIRGPLTASLDGWLYARTGTVADWRRLDEVLRLADPDDWRGRLRAAVVRKDRPELERLARDPQARGLSSTTAHALTEALCQVGAAPLAVEVLTAAQSRHPEDFWLNHLLAVDLGKLRPPRAAEAVGFFRASLALRPDSPGAWLNFGSALRDLNRLAEAEAADRRALDLEPNYADARCNLGIDLARQNRLPEAVEELRRAVALKPALAQAHNNLGLALKRLGRPDEAIDSYRKALECRPRFVPALMNLGWALEERGRSAEAAATYRKALKLQPDAGAYYDLSRALDRRPADDLAAYREALDLDPENLANGLNRLGRAFQQKDRPAEAVAAYERAVGVRPDYATAHYNLGRAYGDLGKTAEEVAAYRRAVELRPDDPESLCNLGLALGKVGELAAAVEHLRRGNEIGQRLPNWRYHSADWLRDAERRLDLDARRPAILRGEDRPATADERALFAQVCRVRGYPAAAAREYGRLLADHPGRAGDRTLMDNAVVTAALAGCRRGVEDDTATPEERAGWRRQALAWLRADLDRAAGGDPSARRGLRVWQRQPALAAFRDADTLADFPEAEREAWRKLWAEIGAIVKQDQG